jgi:hypothetical protein
VPDICRTHERRITVRLNRGAKRSKIVTPPEKSDMLLTKTLFGFRHFNGSQIRSGHSRTSKPCSNGCLGTPRHRSAKVSAYQPPGRSLSHRGIPQPSLTFVHPVMSFHP